MNFVRRGQFSYWNEKVFKIGSIVLAPKPTEIILMSVLQSFITISKALTIIQVLHV